MKSANFYFIIFQMVPKLLQKDNEIHHIFIMKKSKEPKFVRRIMKFAIFSQ